MALLMMGLSTGWVWIDTFGVDDSIDASDAQSLAVERQAQAARGRRQTERDLTPSLASRVKAAAHGYDEVSAEPTVGRRR